MTKLNKQYLLKKTKGGKVAFYLSIATMALLGLIGIDGCIPGNANTIKTRTPYKGIYAVKTIKGNNQFDTNLASHQPFRILARHFASNNTATYGNDSHYYHKTFNKNIGDGYHLIGHGKKTYHMSQKQWNKNQAYNKLHYYHITHGENYQGDPVVSQQK